MAGIEIACKFADKVGWRKGGTWLSYSDLIWNTTAPLGYLPRYPSLPSGVVFCYIYWVWWLVGIFSRAKTCNL